MTDLMFIAPMAVIEEAKDYVNGLDTLWVLLGAMLVFWMQPGFALVEAGLTQSKNTANILMKNFVDFMFGSVLFWVTVQATPSSDGRGSASSAATAMCRQSVRSSSRRSSAPRRRQSSPAQWQNARSSRCMSSSLFSRQLSSTR